MVLDQDMDDAPPKVGIAHFRWNTGAWFGGLIVGTTYLFVGAIAFTKESRSLLFVWIASFGFSLPIGIYFWSRQASIAP